MSAATAGDQAWRSNAEKGSVLGARFVLFVLTAFGRGPARLFLRVLAFYYVLFAREARRGARAFLERVHPRVTFGMLYTQVLRFTQVTLDGVFLLAGKGDALTIRRNGHEHIAGLRDRKEGAILLGAHLGSMYVMRAQSAAESVPVYAVVYTKHAENINRVLSEVAPDSQARLLQMGEGVDFMLKIREHVEAGSLIALLGDRVGRDQRAVEVDFLGGKARFPTGPYILASALKCPVYLTFGIYRDPDRYELFCEPFADRVELPRARRQEALREYVERYAARLEHHASRAPDNWFNFYDFWRAADGRDDD